MRVGWDEAPLGARLSGVSRAAPRKQTRQAGGERRAASAARGLPGAKLDRLKSDID